MAVSKCVSKLVAVCGVKKFRNFLLLLKDSLKKFRNLVHVLKDKRADPGKKGSYPPGLLLSATLSSRA